MFIEYAALSVAGRVRPNNEDDFFILDPATGETSIASSGTVAGHTEKRDLTGGGIVLGVADGLGGHSAGKVASRRACEVVSRVVSDYAPRDGRGRVGALGPILNRAICEADTSIRREGRETPEHYGMCSTLTAAAVSAASLPVLDVVHVGDSRAYLVRRERIARVTRDQTPVQRAIDAGRIKAHEAVLHPYRNLMDQAVGGSEPVAPVRTRVILYEGDLLLLCTDGLTNEMHDDQEILSLITNRRDDGREGMPGDICAALVARANEQGRDNITAVICRFTGTELAAPNSRGALAQQARLTDEIEFTVVTS